MNWLIPIIFSAANFVAGYYIGRQYDHRIRMPHHFVTRDTPSGGKLEVWSSDRRMLDKLRDMYDEPTEP